MKNKCGQAGGIWYCLSCDVRGRPLNAGLRTISQSLFEEKNFRTLENPVCGHTKKTCHIIIFEYVNMTPTKKNTNETD